MAILASMPGPRYPSLLNTTTLAMAVSILLGRKRSFLADAAALVGRLDPPVNVIGRVPDLAGASWLVVVNHNHRPGFIAWWMPLSITATLQREVHWIMTAAWRSVGGLTAPWLVRLVARLLQRAANVYGFTSMPPMPPNEGETQARARAVRQVLKHVDSTPLAIIGLAPEGRDNPAGVLIEPPPGVGRFACQLARRNLRLLPTGVYEEGGSLCLHIGSPMPLPQIGGPAEERDRQMRDVLMRGIAQCVPDRMRGAYA